MGVQFARNHVNLKLVSKKKKKKKKKRYLFLEYNKIINCECFSSNIHPLIKQLLELELLDPTPLLSK